MKVVELARDVLALPPHHDVCGTLDGWDCPIIETRAVGLGECELVLDLPEGTRLLPTEPTEEMCEAVEHLGLSPVQAAMLWATMTRAFDNEE